LVSTGAPQNPNFVGSPSHKHTLFCGCTLGGGRGQQGQGAGLWDCKCCGMEGEKRGGRGAGVAGEVGGGVMLRKPTPSRPQVTVAMRGAYTSEATVAGVYRAIESPMSSMVSGFLADPEQEMDTRSFSHLLAGAIAAPASGGDGGEDKGATADSGTGSPSLRVSSPGGASVGAGGSFADRLAARGAAHTAAGFASAEAAGGGGGGGVSMPPSSVQFRSLPPSRIPIPRSAGYLTIPPGLSPTTLFDASPVLLSTSQVLTLTLPLFWCLSFDGILQA
jgi:hypothetical protein